MIGDEVITYLGDFGFDEYGDPIGGPPAEVEIGRCAIEQQPLAEQPERARSSNAIGYRIFTPAMPAGVTLTPRSLLRVRGVECEVDGSPEWWPDTDPDVTGWTISCHARQG